MLLAGVWDLEKKFLIDAWPLDADSRLLCIYLYILIQMSSSAEEVSYEFGMRESFRSLGSIRESIRESIEESIA